MSRKKRFCAALLVICLVFTMAPVVFAVSTVQASCHDGIVDVQFPEQNTGTTTLILYKDGATVYQKEQDISGAASTQFGLPVRSLPKGEYLASISLRVEDQEIGAVSITVTTGVDDPVSSSTIGNDISPNTPQMSRAIMGPYAKVFGSSNMTGTPLVELKRHDFVQVIRDYGNIAYVKYFIQSGHGSFDYQAGHIGANGEHVVSGITYASDDDLTGTGYIYTSAFELPATSQEVDIAREAVELAYSRLGSKGVYNQMRRYIDYYTDCSAFISYCYYNAGIDWGTDTTCNGISRWATGQSENKVLWDGGADDMAGIAALADHAAVHADSTADTPSLTLNTSNNSNLDLGSLIKYNRKVDAAVINALKPGDILFFNHFQSVTDQFECNLGSWQVVEYAEGFDHVGMVVGVKGNSISIIESTPLSSNPDRGVIMSTLSQSKIDTIGKIVRPTGCEEINPFGEYLAQYSGTYYADVDDIASPIPGLNADNISTITGSAAFGPRIHPVTGAPSFHTGIDLGSRLGATMGSDVVAAADGEVVLVSNTCTHNLSSVTCSCGGSYGNYVLIQHSDGVKTRYAHLSTATVTVGQVVTRGETVGTVGTTGRSTGPHLHFEIIRNGNPIDPAKHINFSL